MAEAIRSFFRKLRRSSSKAAILLNGRHTQKSKRCRAMAMYEPLRTDLIAYLDETLCRGCLPERLWGEFRSGQGERVFPGRIDPEQRPRPVVDRSRFGMGQPIWSVPPGARQRCSAVRSAKGAFCCRPGQGRKRLPHAMGRSCLHLPSPALKRSSLLWASARSALPSSQPMRHCSLTSNSGT